MISMRTMKISFPIWLVLMILLSSTTTSAAGINHEFKNGKTTLYTDTIAIEVVGQTNTPSFFFWDQGDSDTTYKLSFDSVFEYEDDNGDGGFTNEDDKRVPNTQISLASYSWDFGKFVETKDGEEITGVDFNITSSIVGKADIFIQFRMHLSSDTEMKFDVVIDEYSFVSDTSFLALGFKLITTGNEKMEQNQNTVQFGDAYFEANDTAEAGNETKSVKVSAGEENGDKKIYLSYEQFEGRLVHDPTIGVQGDSTDQNTDTIITGDVLPVLSKGELLSLTVLASVIFIAIPSLIYRSKRKS